MIETPKPCNDYQVEVLGHIEEILQRPETKHHVNFEDRRTALKCAVEFYAQKSWVDVDEVLNFAEHFEEWLRR